MIAKPLEAIETGDIEQLVTDRVAESRTLDYKEKLPGQSDGEKKEFLADITSFANASGGDLVFGVAEERDAQNRPTGMPKEITGLGTINVDAEKLRLEAIIRDGIEPRVPGVQIRAINGSPAGLVLIIRVRQSWNPPHMVKGSGAGSYRFYSRNSAGKYPLDSTEIRAAFALSEALPERIRRFRDERLAKIIADETPVSLEPHPRLVLHMVPVSSMLGTTTLDVNAVAKSDGVLLRPFDTSGWNWRYNLDGFLTYSPSEQTRSHSYLQVFRNGCLEAVAVVETSPGQVDRKQQFIPSAWLERELIEAVHRYSGLLQHYGIEPPIVILISLNGVSGTSMATPAHARTHRLRDTTIDRDLLLLPEVIIDQYSRDLYVIARQIREMLDALWQASGWSGSPYYDQEGNWVPKRNSW